MIFQESENVELESVIVIDIQHGTEHPYDITEQRVPFSVKIME